MPTLLLLIPLLASETAAGEPDVGKPAAGKAAAGDRTMITAEWLQERSTQPAGPVDAPGPRWQRLGPPGIAPRDLFVHAVAFAPDDPQTIMIGTRPQGLFVSRDGGENWAQPAFSPAASRGVGVNSDSLRFLPPTGDAAAPLLVGYERKGLFRSDDLLQTQPKRLNRGFVNRNIVTIAVDPDDPNRLFAGTDDGLHRSENGGRSWQRLGDGLPDRKMPSCTKVQFDPTDPNRLLAAYMDADTGPAGLGEAVDEAGIYRSEDRGRTWAASNDGRPVGLFDTPGLGLTLQTEAALTLHIATDGTAYAASMIDGLHRSDDGGRSWNRCGRDTAAFRPNGSIDAVTTAPGDPGRVYVSQGGGYVLRSRDGGRTWQPIVNGLRMGRESGAPTLRFQLSDNSGNSRPATATGAEFVNRVYGLAMPTESRRLFAATSAGLYAVDLTD